MNISNVNSINNAIDKINKQSDMLTIKEATPNGPSFEQYLNNTLKNVNDLQVESDKQSYLLATGQAENVHDVTIASAKAKVSLDLTMAVRGKVVEAYKEIMRMQV